MKEFFKVTDLQTVLEYRTKFPQVKTEEIPLVESVGRILAKDMVADDDLPDFPRAIVDGYAVKGASTFGSSESNPAYLKLSGSIAMGESPEIAVGPGEAAQIATGGMLPPGADSVVMIEHTEAIDDTTIEVYRSVAPGQNMIAVGEDIKKQTRVLLNGQLIRPQEAGLLAALGKQQVAVYQKPVIGIISTGDEIVPINETPGRGQIRDINSYTLSGLIHEAGAVAVSYGIVRDDFKILFEKCKLALEQCDMILISGGSSVGARDYTADVLSALRDAKILVHGISISPGKPTILAKAQNKAFWGMPGHVVSAMIVFSRVVKPFVEHLSGQAAGQKKELRLQAKLSRNVASRQGRIDFIRVQLRLEEGRLWADPVLGKSGLISTMVNADGLIEIDINTEGLDKGAEV
ncbi:MAG: molybdopterin molybdotransferase MoeA, partial [Desulfobacterales bacterium]|nr:molybdopterin molybdotransferase MoeA [Desulfobacterales bacterium]